MRNHTPKASALICLELPLRHDSQHNIIFDLCTIHIGFWVSDRASEVSISLVPAFVLDVEHIKLVVYKHSSCNITINRIIFIGRLRSLTIVCSAGLHDQPSCRLTYYCLAIWPVVCKLLMPVHFDQWTPPSNRPSSLPRRRAALETELSTLVVHGNSAFVVVLCKWPSKFLSLTESLDEQPPSPFVKQSLESI